MKVEGRDALKRQCRDGAEGANRDPGRLEGIAVIVGREAPHRAVRGHQFGSNDLGGQAPEPAARPVGGGGQGPRDGLVLDVAQVRQSHAVKRQRGVQVGDGHAGLDGHLTALAVDGHESPIVVELDQRAGCAGRIRERVTATDDLDPATRGGRRLDHLDELLDAGRMGDDLGRAGLVAGPVGPRPPLARLAHAPGCYAAGPIRPREPASPVSRGRATPRSASAAPCGRHRRSPDRRPRRSALPCPC